MRILNVIDTLAVGGAERYVCRVAARLRSRGFDIQVCALDAKGPLRDELTRAGVGVATTRYSERFNRSNTLTLLRTARDIARLAGDFDIVHSYLFWSDVLGSVGARIAGRRRIIVSRRALHSWRHGSSRLLHGLESMSNLLATELIANSRAVLDDTERHERLLPRRRGVIYNGIDPSDYRPTTAPSTAELRVVTVGALDRRKGQELALEAVALVRKAGVNAVLDLVGDGPDRALLEERTEQLGLDSAVLFSGEQLDPRPHLERAHVFLLPSRQEGFSNALLEAMAAGLPAVVTDVGGNAEALEDGIGGHVVPSGDADAMTEALLDLTTATRRAAAGAANRRRVVAHFSIDASADALAAWYASGN